MLLGMAASRGNSRLGWPRSESFDNQDMRPNYLNLDLHNGSEVGYNSAQGDGPGANRHSQTSQDGTYQIRKVKGAARVYGHSKTFWEDLKDEENPDRPFAPWSCEEELELITWLSSEGLSQGAINRFLETKYAKTRLDLSFRSASHMYELIATQMPKGPKWKTVAVHLPDVPNEEHTLFYRDPIECAEFLLGNPNFRECIDYEPCEIFEADGKTRVFHEMTSGTTWNDQQVAQILFRLLMQDTNLVLIGPIPQRLLPKGTTIMGIILASDKTHLTNFSGDKSMHAVYISIGNIHKDVRKTTAASSCAWMLLAKIPTSKFAATSFNTMTEDEKMPGILSRQLYHKCMKIVLEPLRLDQRKIRTVVDASGNTRRAVGILMAWIADLEEQYVIAGLAPGSCPSCLAQHDDLGSPNACERRTGQSILDILARIRLKYPGADTWQFVNLAKKKGLNGVEEPCWEGLPIDIGEVICVDILHGLHKMFKDHMMGWITNTVGEEELDARFMAQPHRVGFRNFHSGISHISQWSGREHRDLQHHVLPAIVNTEGVSAQPRVVKAIRALLDFIYKAQFHMHTDSTLQQMSKDLADFHRSKNVFIQNESRRGEKDVILHMNIPKLHALLHYYLNIRRLGSADNYSTEVSETLHIIFCKEAYDATNHKEFSRQIIDYLIRLESLQLSSWYHQWQCDAAVFGEPDKQDMKSRLTSLSLFKHDSCPRSIVLADDPHLSKHISRIVEIFDLPDLIPSIHRFLDSGDSGFQRHPRYDYAGYDVPSHFTKLSIWHRFTLNLPRQNEFYSFEHTSIRCQPAALSATKRNQFDPVLIEVEPEQAGIKRYRVAELRLVFRVAGSRKNTHYAYVLWFGPISNPDPLSKLRRVSKEYRFGQRAGGIVELNRIKYPCALAPILDEDWDRGIKQETCYDMVEDFYLNAFASHQMYNLLQ